VAISIQKTTGKFFLLKTAPGKKPEVYVISAWDDIKKKSPAWNGGSFSKPTAIWTSTP
jgi:hypothetical protein